MLSKNDKRRILSKVMDYIHSEGLVWKDDFPIDVTDCYTSLLSTTSQLPDLASFLEKSTRIKTSFFMINRKISKKDFYSGLHSRLNNITGPMLERAKRKVEAPAAVFGCERVYVDGIDSFRKVNSVEPHAIIDLVPLKISEENIKNSLAEILGEKFVPKDWPGEKSDLYTTRVVLRGKRIDTAFLLKGPSVDILTISKLGKRGNQVLKLTKEPAQLFTIQHVGKIDSDVIEHLENEVTKQSRSRNLKLYYCVIDGIDTTRILAAYGKLQSQ